MGGVKTNGRRRRARKGRAGRAAVDAGGRAVRPFLSSIPRGGFDHHERAPQATGGIPPLSTRTPRAVKKKDTHFLFAPAHLMEVTATAGVGEEVALIKIT